MLSVFQAVSTTAKIYRDLAKMENKMKSGLSPGALSLHVTHPPGNYFSSRIIEETVVTQHSNATATKLL